MAKIGGRERAIFNLAIALMLFAGMAAASSDDVDAGIASQLFGKASSAITGMATSIPIVDLTENPDGECDECYSAMETIVSSPTRGNGSQSGSADTSASCPCVTGYVIYGWKWLDQNMNKILDGGEPGISGWEVTLHQVATHPDCPTPIADQTTTTTAAKGGMYEFRDLPAGVYEVTETEEPGWVRTFPVGSATHTAPIELDKNTKDSWNRVCMEDIHEVGPHPLDFGNIYGGGLIICKYVDVDFSGAKNIPPDRPQNGWLMKVYTQAGALVGQCRTWLQGCCAVSGLAIGGNYIVEEEVRPKWEAVDPDSCPIMGYDPCHIINSFDGSEMVEFLNNRTDYPPWPREGIYPDLGDTPTSYNHFQEDMKAYPMTASSPEPVVTAYYPTVHEPDLSGLTVENASGPCNYYERVILGNNISGEYDADLNPDEDANLTNINATEDDPNNDFYDDGLFKPLNLTSCAPSTFRFNVTVVGEVNETYAFNAWFDWNKDGDWNDNSLQCPGSQDSPEWAVQNQYINFSELTPVDTISVGSTTANVYTITSDSFLPYNYEDNVWMRMMIFTNASGPVNEDSSVPENSSCFLDGEVEDYYCITPHNALENVWSTTQNLDIWEKNNITFYANFSFEYADYCEAYSVNPEDVYCTFTENATELLPPPKNMTYNATSGLFEYKKAFFDPGENFGFSITCYFNGRAYPYRTGTFDVQFRDIEYYEFDGPETTQFNFVPDPEHIVNPIVENRHGKIQWIGTVNALNQNLDANVEIQDNFIDVIIQNLHGSFNVAAYITLYNLAISDPVIFIDGEPCPYCNVIDIEGDGELKNITFWVPHFTNYSIVSMTLMEIGDTTDYETRHEYQDVLFWANFRNASTGLPIKGTGISCKFTENSTGTWSPLITMQYNKGTKRYEYTRDFSNPGNHIFNVTCDGTSQGYNLITLSDNFTITHDAASPNATVWVTSENDNRSDGDITCWVYAEDNVRKTGMIAYYTWFKNDAVFESGEKTINNATETAIRTIIADELTRYDTWRCEVIVSDLVNNATTQNESILIRNSLPRIDVELIGVTPFIDITENVSCVAELFDKDGDNMTVRTNVTMTNLTHPSVINIFNTSTRFEIESPSTINPYNISSEDTKYNQTWVCNITANDGYEDASGTDLVEFLQRTKYSAQEAAPDVRAFLPVDPAGLTTNFSINRILVEQNQEIENYTNAIVRNGFGYLNILEYANYSKLNLTKHIKISQNNFTINLTGNMSRLNLPSEIALYNLSFVYPEIYYSTGEVCDTCAYLSYFIKSATKKDLFFNITGYTSFPTAGFYAGELAPDVSAFGSTTDFSITAIDDIANVSDVYLQNNSAGKIEFLEPINATRLNLSKYVKIIYRNLVRDTSNSQVEEILNVPAEITLFQVNMTYPVIERNGERCPGDVCSFIYYDTTNDIKFNVTDFDYTPEAVYNVSEGAPLISKFNGSSTTDFRRPGTGFFDYDIQNTSNVTLEIEGIGKLAFLEPLDVLAGSRDWNSHIEIGLNNYLGKYASVNTTALPNLDKRARTTFYNLKLVNPLIIYDNGSSLVPCPAPQCIEISYPFPSEGCKTSQDCTLIFDVQDFASNKYLAIENDTTPHFVSYIPDQVWYENKNNTISNIEQYVFDADNTTLLFDYSIDCSDITVNLNQTTKDVLLEPDFGFVGTCTLTLNASDGDASDYLNVSLIVVPNLPPQFINGPVIIPPWNEDTNMTINIANYFWDPDNDTLIYGQQFLIGGNITIEFDSATGNAKLIPDENWYGERSIKFKASDEKATTWTEPYTRITVNSVNDLPELTKKIPNNIQSYKAINEDENYTINLSEHFEDVEDGKDLNYSIVIGEGSMFNVTLEDEMLTFVPEHNWNGYESFVVIAKDKDGGTKASNVFTIYVNSVPDDVTAINSTVYIEIPEGGNVSINATEWLFDPDYDAVYYFTYMSGSPHVVVNLDPYTGLGIIRALNDFFGAEQINVSATDGSSTAFTIVTVNITNLYDAPYLATDIPNQIWSEDTNATIDLNNYFVDVDHAGFIYEVVAVPANIDVIVNQTTGAIIFVPEADWSGVNNVQFKATANDSEAAEVLSNVVELTVVAVNDAPVLSSTINPQIIIKNKNKTIDLDDYFTDIDSSLSYSTAYGGNITIQIDNFEGTATIIPDTGFVGQSWAKFLATDSTYPVFSNNATVKVVLGPSILKNTKINGTLYPDGNYTNLTGILVSNLTNAHINISNLTSCKVEDSSIINATLEQCTIINSLVKNYVGYGCIVEDSTVDPPTIPYDITGSNITGGSVIYESDVINSDVDSSNITGSAGKDCTISNSYLRNCDFLDCVILNGIVYGGEITFNGSTYDADTQGTTNLTNIINYPPYADFTVSSSLKPNTSIEFNSTSSDSNIYNGTGLLPLNDSLIYLWNFSDGNTSTAPSLARNFTSEGDYNVTLTVTDNFGEYSIAMLEFTISKQPATPSTPTTTGGGGGGGGGRRTVSCTESWNCTAWDPCTPYGIQYRTCIDMNQCGTFLYMPIQDQGCDYTPTCTDFVQNQDETDVDCGGSCKPCRDEMMCNSDDDCQNSCVDGICRTKPEAPAVVTPAVRPRLPPPPPVIEKPTGMQAVLGIFTKQLLGVEVWAYLLATFLTIVFVMGGAMAGKYRAKKLREVPTYSYYDALKAAIRRDVERGVPEMDIKNSLVGGGWPEHIVNQAIVETNNMILQPAVQKDITKGYDETKLKKALLNKGWPKSRVSEVMSDSNMEMLRRSMETNFAKGYSADAIGKEMKKMGWPKEMVDHIVNEFKYLK